MLQSDTAPGPTADVGAPRVSAPFPTPATWRRALARYDQTCPLCAAPITVSATDTATIARGCEHINGIRALIVQGIRTGRLS